MNTKNLLDEYSNNLAGIDLLNSNKQELIDKVIPPEIKARLDEIEAEFTPIFENINTRNQELIDMIKAEVVAAGETVSGEFHQAVYMKGRTSWDSKSLEGFAAAHPEILQFKTIGSPSVSIKARSK
jgi:hypothetical protein